MMIALAITASLLILPGPPAPGTTDTAPPDATPSVVEVHLVDKGGGQWRFEPAAIQAHPGDVIRFIQDDVVPHNVEFKKTPAGANLGAAKMGPFLLAKGDTYELNIDARFVAGEYAFSCTPHEVMGMKATLVVGPTSPDEGGLR